MRIEVESEGVGYLARAYNFKSYREVEREPAVWAIRSNVSLGNVLCS